MPARAPHFCVVPGCATLTTGRRCPRHAVAAEQARPNYALRRWYRTPQWKALRARILRDQAYAVPSVTRWYSNSRWTTSPSMGVYPPGSGIVRTYTRCVAAVINARRNVGSNDATLGRWGDPWGDPGEMGRCWGDPNDVFRP